MVDQLGVDPVDGQPVWVAEQGQALVAGYLAWERLGTGQRHETWLAWSQDLWSPVVVKLARPHQIRHPRASASLRREAYSLGELAHPAFPALLADGRAGEVPHLVTEFVDGPALDDAVDEDGPFAAAEAAELLSQLTAGVRWLHRNGVAHLDLKPANIVLRDGRPKLLDFGSARPLGRLQPANAPIGSPGYAAPDLEAGAPISAAMDLYGLGTVLYEVLTGTPAFDPDTRPEHRPAPDLLAFGHAAPELAALARHLLAPEPHDRPRGADSVLHALLGAAAPDQAPCPDFAATHLPRPAPDSSMAVLRVL